MVVGESSQPPVKDTALTFQCPILTSTNYTIWRMRMEVLFGIHGVWGVVDPCLDDAKKNNIVKGLFQSIPEDLVLQIRNLKTGKETWEAIKTRNLWADRVKEARFQTLITDFENLKMSDNDSIDAYAPKLSGIASKSATLGEVMSEHKLVKKFLTSLPRRFVHIVAALEQVLDLKMTGFEDVVGRLKVYEERVKQEDKANDSQEKLLYARTDYSNRNSDSSRGRGRGSHFVSRCPQRNRDYEANLTETHKGDMNHEEGTFFMMNHIQKTIFMNEEKYTPQNSESNTDDEDDVWFEDGSCVSIKGKGSILFQGKNEEQKLLKDVYYISALRSNVISLGQATISGYDIPIRGGFLTMRDSCGSLLIKVPRSVNRLYKAQLKVKKPYCLQANIDEESWL
nr:hypothetical protein [Tanacetum cinerariifolium]